MIRYTSAPKCNVLDAEFAERERDPAAERSPRTVTPENRVGLRNRQKSRSRMPQEATGRRQATFDPPLFGVFPMKDMTGYPGSKGGSGVAERIIRQMPPHLFYIEGFAGSAAVFRRKLAAQKSILIDADPAVCESLRETNAGNPDVEVVCDSFIDHASIFRWSITPSTLVYLDPPYLRSTRTRLLYDFEFHSIEEHTALIELAVKLPCMVMISGYRSKLYAKLLKTWRSVEIPTMSRGGPRVEVVWCNFDLPELLHDPRYAGGDYRERENLSRKKKRWAKKFATMGRPERQAIAAALAACDRPAVEMALRSSPTISAVQDPKQPLGKNK